MGVYLTSRKALCRTLADAARRDVHVLSPVTIDNRRTWHGADVADLEGGALDLGPARATEPVKALFLPPRGEVARFFGEDAGAEPPERIVVGARACDVAALRILDHVFLEGDFEDPFYAARRERTLVVSADCTGPYETCFCVAVEGRPHAEGGFDLNLSEVNGNGEFIVETGSPKGEKFVEENRKIAQLLETKGFGLSGDEPLSNQIRRRTNDGGGWQRRLEAGRHVGFACCVSIADLHVDEQLVRADRSSGIGVCHPPRPLNGVLSL